MILHDVVRTGDLAGVRRAAERSSKKDTTDKWGNTALWIACQEGHLHIVRFLTNRGFDIHKANKNGWYPIHAAASKGRHLIVQYLMNNGKCEPGVKTINGYTPLMLACQAGDVKTVHMLLEAAFNIDEEDFEGLSAVHHAAKGGHLEVIKVLLEESDPSILTSNSNTYTPLVCAIQQGHQHIVSYICTRVDVKADDVFRPPGLNKSIVNIAEACNYPEIVSFLRGHTQPGLNQKKTRVTALIKGDSISSFGSRDSGLGSVECTISSSVESSIDTTSEPIYRRSLPRQMQVDERMDKSVSESSEDLYDDSAIVTLKSDASTDHGSEQSITKNVEEGFPSPPPKPLLHLSPSVGSNLPSYQSRSQSNSPWLTRKAGHEPIEIVSIDYDYLILRHIKSTSSLRFSSEEALKPLRSYITWPVKSDEPLVLHHGSCNQIDSDICREDLMRSWEEFYLQFDEFTSGFEKETFETLMSTGALWVNFLPVEQGKISNNRTKHTIRAVGKKPYVENLKLELKRQANVIRDESVDKIKRQLDLSDGNKEMVYKAMAQAQQSRPGVRIDKRGNQLVMYGTKEDVYNASYDLAMFESTPKNQLITPVAKGLCRLLKHEKVAEHLQNTYGKSNWLVEVHTDAYTLYGKTEDDLQTMNRIIKEQTDCDSLQIEQSAKVTLETKAWIDFVKFLSYKYETVDIATMNHQIRIYALKTQLQKVVFEISKHLESHSIYSHDAGNLNEQEIRLLKLAFRQDLNKAERELKEGNVKFRFPDDGGLVVEGYKMYIDKAKEAITKIQKKVTIVEYAPGTPGLDRFICGKLGQSVLQGLETNHKIVTEVTMTESQDDVPETVTMAGLYQGAAEASNFKVHIGGLSVEVFEGDLLGTEADAILVCTKADGCGTILGGDADRFVAAAGAEVKHEISRINYKADKVERTTSGKLPSQCIIHMKPPSKKRPWTDRVLASLEKAEQWMYGSVAMSVLEGGCKESLVTTALTYFNAFETFANQNPKFCLSLKIFTSEKKGADVAIFRDVFYSMVTAGKISNVSFKDASATTIERTQRCKSINVFLRHDKSEPSEVVRQIDQELMRLGTITRNLDDRKTALALQKMDTNQKTLLVDLNRTLEVSLEISSVNAIRITGFKDDVMLAEAICIRQIADRNTD